MLEIMGLIALVIGIGVIYLGGVLWFASAFTRDSGLGCLGGGLFLFGIGMIWLAGHLSPFGITRVTV